jgi:hypothetical protein
VTSTLNIPLWDPKVLKEFMKFQAFEGGWTNDMACPTLAWGCIRADKISDNLLLFKGMMTASIATSTASAGRAPWSSALWKR